MAASQRSPQKRLPTNPAHPERVCWGCDKYCRANDLACGNGSERTPHPCELFGDDWHEWAGRDDDEPRPAGGSDTEIPVRLRI